MLCKKIQALGTNILIKINTQSQKAHSALETAFNEAYRIEKEYSRFIENNELSNLNNKLGKWQKVSKELFSLLNFGKKFEKESEGAFSLSVKELLENWGYSKNTNIVKKKKNEISRIFELRPETQEVYISVPLEIGAIGKGYALDCMKKHLDEYEDVFINAGGDIYARGKNREKPWTCYFEHPRNDLKIIGEIDINNEFLAASSPLKRSWDNKHHIVDAKVQKPANKMLANYVLAKSGILADGYSTMLFTLGYDDAKKIVRKNNIAAMLIGAYGDIFISSEFKGKLYGK